MQVFKSFLILCSLCMTVSDSFAADAKVCELKKNELQQKEQQIHENTEFLGKNRAYLTMLSPKEASKFLKVEGNIMMILQRIDEYKKDAIRLEEDLEKEGCDSIQGENKSGQST